MRANRLAAAVFLATAAVALPACGDDVDNGVSGRQPSESESLTIYASLPLRGPQESEAVAVLRGMKLALADARSRIAGKTIRLKDNDDTGSDGRWDDGAVADNAREAIRPSTTIAYIGELDSGASALSIPILNEAGILQVSPASGYMGLTRGGGVVEGEPAKYYPSGRRTFGRVTPGDRVQAQAQVRLQVQAGCRNLYLLHDEELYGTGLAAAIRDAPGKGRMDVVADAAFSPRAEDFDAVVADVAQRRADCVFVGTAEAAGAARLLRALHRADARLELFVPDRLVTTSFTRALGSAASSTQMTSPRLRRSDYPPSARALLRRYSREYGGPAPIDALFGYATMDAVLHSIRTATGSGSIQSRTIRAFFELDRDSVLGRYTIDGNGDSSLSRYGSYRVVDGRPRFAAVIDTAR